MKHFLTTIVSDVRLRQVMLELRLRGAHTSAFDRDVQPLFSSSAGIRRRSSSCSTSNYSDKSSTSCLAASSGPSTCRLM